MSESSSDQSQVRLNEKGTIELDVFETALEVIDMRSFSNLWYWIMLAVQWSIVSHWVIGVPQDMIQRARKDGGQAQQDLEHIVRINVDRLLHIIDSGAFLLIGLIGFWMSVLVILAFYYHVEFAQAVFLLLAPLLIVVWVSVRTCRKIVAGENTGEPLFHRLTVHRRVVQVIGMLSIGVAAFYGTWQNISASILY
jgi:hypothetical protein